MSLLPGGWQTADFGPNTALRIVDAIRADIRAGKVKTRTDVRQAFPEINTRMHLLHVVHQVARVLVVEACRT